MSVVETPILLRADVDKNAYRGEAMSQLRILKHEMALGGLTTSVRTVRYPNGVVIQCRKSFEYETVDIFVPKSLPQEEPSKRLKPDFFAHPRSGNVFQYEVTEDIKIPAIKHGGYYLNDGTFYDLTSYVAYPSVDDDHGTFVLAENKDKVTALWAAPTVENYGNCWWTSEDSTTLSWKGNPSKQFPIGASFNISGLTRQTTDGYTVFGRYIYSNGVKLCEGPAADINEPTLTLVVGACYTKDSDDKSWLLCLTVSFTNSAYILQVWRSEDTGKTWQLLNEFPSLRAAVTAFISQDGRRFVYGGQLYQIDAAVSSVVAGAKIPTSVTGTRTIHGAGGYGSEYSYNGSGICWPAMGTDESLAYSRFSVSARFSGSLSGLLTPATKLVPVYRGNPATQVTIQRIFGGVSACNAGTGGVDAIFTASANGAYCSAVWSGVNCYKGLTATKKLQACDGEFSVTVTLLPQAVSASLQFGATSPAIIVSGNEQVSVGAAYTAANTLGTVTWSISKGAINSATGVITDVTGCGTAVITATDECGRTGTLTVRMPTGVWVSDGNQRVVASFGTPLNTIWYDGRDCNCYGTNAVHMREKTPNIKEYAESIGSSKWYEACTNGHFSVTLIAGGKRYFSELECQHKSSIGGLAGFAPWPGIPSVVDSWSLNAALFACAHDGLNAGCCNCQASFDGQPYSVVLRSSNNYSETWSCA